MKWKRAAFSTSFGERVNFGSTPTTKDTKTTKFTHGYSNTFVPFVLSFVVNKKYRWPQFPIGSEMELQQVSIIW
jgi:hypothetical protein